MKLPLPEEPPTQEYALAGKALRRRAWAHTTGNGPEQFDDLFFHEHLEPKKAFYPVARLFVDNPVAVFRKAYEDNPDFFDKGPYEIGVLTRLSFATGKARDLYAFFVEKEFGVCQFIACGIELGDATFIPELLAQCDVEKLSAIASHVNSCGPEETGFFTLLLEKAPACFHAYHDRVKKRGDFYAPSYMAFILHTAGQPVQGGYSEVVDALANWQACVGALPPGEIAKELKGAIPLSVVLYKDCYAMVARQFHQAEYEAYFGALFFGDADLFARYLLKWCKPESLWLENLWLSFECDEDEFHDEDSFAKRVLQVQDPLYWRRWGEVLMALGPEKLAQKLDKNPKALLEEAELLKLEQECRKAARRPWLKPQP